jgi:ankyrin repeat protein
MKLLLENGADVRHSDEHGQTALYMAACYNRNLLVPLLFEQGAIVDARTNERGTALHYAARCGVKTNVRWLLNAGAAIEAEDEEGIAPVRSAAEYGHDNVVRLLLQRGADCENVNMSTMRQNARQKPTGLRPRMRYSRGKLIKQVVAVSNLICPSLPC